MISNLLVLMVWAKLQDLKLQEGDEMMMERVPARIESKETK
jgi:hypothetical protein